MGTMEIILLVLGIAAFIISYFIPERKSGKELDTEQIKEKINQTMEEELETSKRRLEEMTDETVNYSMEKTERSLERITNEKIMALGEYSDTVMSQINSNHQETVFMHDMLNTNKRELEDLMNTATQTSKEAFTSANEAVELSSKALKTAQLAQEKAEAAEQMSVVAEDRMITARKTIKGETTTESQPIEKNTKSDTKTATKGKTAGRKKSQKVDTQLSFDEDLVAQDGSISLQFAPGTENSVNSNERILELHKKGRSNMAIAKDLGLGIGEVKLVIDLFEKK